ncbi:hypothetical protein F4804DRAFT_306005 [Jackrogersella minutella]|nr:hypothetical protein F4804DRAFT_306005 [Jackrogersella minutella]
MTTPTLIGMPSTIMGISETVSSTSIVVSSLALLSTSYPSPLAPGQPELDPSSVISKISLQSLLSPSLSPSSSFHLQSGSDSLVDASNSSVVPDMSPVDKGLSRGQIAAIVAVVSTVIFLIGLFIAMRCFVARRRQYYVEELPKRGLGVSRADKESQTEQDYTNGTRTSVADSSRSSIWGDVGCSVMPASSFSGDVWDSRLWPLPPGHSDRYTFFSERSSSTLDETLEVEHLSRDQGDGPWNERNHNAVVTRRESGAESRCDSIWGISEVSIAH